MTRSCMYAENTTHVFERAYYHSEGTPLSVANRVRAQRSIDLNQWKPYLKSRAPQTYRDAVAWG